MVAMVTDFSDDDEAALPFDSLGCIDGNNLAGKLEAELELVLCFSLGSLHSGDSYFCLSSEVGPLRLYLPDQCLVFGSALKVVSSFLYDPIQQYLLLLGKLVCDSYKVVTFLIFVRDGF